VTPLVMANFPMAYRRPDFSDARTYYRAKAELSRAAARQASCAASALHDQQPVQAAPGSWEARWLSCCRASRTSARTHPESILQPARTPSDNDAAACK
jgi:hypothetical protein